MVTGVWSGEGQGIETASGRCYLPGMADTTKADVAELRGDITEIRNDLLWMKRIGGVIIVLLAVPILRDILSVLN